MANVRLALNRLRPGYVKQRRKLNMQYLLYVQLADADSNITGIKHGVAL